MAMSRNRTVLGTLISNNMFQAIQALTARTGMTMSEYVRIVLETQEECNLRCSFEDSWTSEWKSPGREGEQLRKATLGDGARIAGNSYMSCRGTRMANANKGARLSTATSEKLRCNCGRF
jgi:hypothetical protein